MINKDFDSWNILKKSLHESSRNKPQFNEGDIWWCSLGINIGNEQDGKNELFERPVLVLIKFNESIALVVSLTSRIRNSLYYLPLRNHSVILSQVRLVSIKRFQRFVIMISPDELMYVKKRIASMIMRHT